jgi:enoyl-CoA hydratase/carnithine racemase
MQRALHLFMQDTVGSLFGESVSGVRAHALGLAWDAVPDDCVVPRALRLAETTAAAAAAYPHGDPLAPPRSREPPAT